MSNWIPLKPGSMDQAHRKGKQGNYAISTHMFYFEETAVNISMFCGVVLGCSLKVFVFAYNKPKIKTTRPKLRD